MIMIDQDNGETLTWPKCLDNYGLLSGQIASFMTSLRSEKIPALKCHPIVPFKLNPDQDPHLCSLTNNRLSMFSHVEAPDYLRTKPDPLVEQAETDILKSVSSTDHQQTVNVQVHTFNKQLQRVQNAMQSARANKTEAASSSVLSRGLTQDTSDPKATLQLFGMVQHGYGSKSS